MTLLLIVNLDDLKISRPKPALHIKNGLEGGNRNIKILNPVNIRRYHECKKKNTRCG
jgi:hypothetical protein